MQSRKIKPAFTAGGINLHPPTYKRAPLTDSKLTDDTISQKIRTLAIFHGLQMKHVMSINSSYQETSHNLHRNVYNQ